MTHFYLCSLTIAISLSVSLNTPPILPHCHTNRGTLIDMDTMNYYTLVTFAEVLMSLINN